MFLNPFAIGKRGVSNKSNISAPETQPEICKLVTGAAKDITMRQQDCDPRQIALAEFNSGSPLPAVMQVAVRQTYEKVRDTFEYLTNTTDDFGDSVFQQYREGRRKPLGLER